MDLEIRFKKHRGGAVSMSCKRRDGSVTWQRQEGARAGFFPVHDLTHYAVETTLGARDGFYGLICEGWNIDDFDKPWPKGPLPVEATRIELLVGFLDSERASGASMTARTMREFSVDFAATTGSGGTAAHGFGPLEIEEAKLIGIRRRCNGLVSRWVDWPVDREWILPFERGVSTTAGGGDSSRPHGDR